MDRDGPTKPSYQYSYNYGGQSAGDARFAEASAPLMGDAASNEAEHFRPLQPPPPPQQQPQQPYAGYNERPPAYYAPGEETYYVPPAYRVERSGGPGCMHTTLRLALFHLLNAVLGIVGFALVVTGVSGGAALLPLCCFGIVVLRVVLAAVGFLAKLDIQLANYASPSSDRVFVRLPPSDGSVSGSRLAPALSEFSPLSLMATLYFLTLKFALGLVSCVTLALFLAIPATVVGALSDSDVQIRFGDDDDVTFTWQDDPLSFAIATACLFVISLALLHLVARLSCAATRFFCAERFTLTPRYFPPTTAPYYAAPTASYGTTGY